MEICQPLNNDCTKLNVTQVFKKNIIIIITTTTTTRTGSNRSGAKGSEK